MKLAIMGFTESRRCDNCEKEADTFHVRCESGTLDADLCGKCLVRQCRMRAKAIQTDSTICRSAEGGAS